MKTTRNTCKILLLGLAIAAVGCQPRGPAVPPAGEEAAADSLRFDPLELPQDLAVVPNEYPVAADVKGQETIVRHDEDIIPRDTTLADLPPEVPVSTDTLNHQAFKIQIFTSKLFGDARWTKRVAEEIFDRPVFLDYEVPYFKVRVGSFSDRYEAEDYARRVRAAGYDEAWVVVTTVKVREAVPMYDDAALPGYGDSLRVTDTLPVPTESVEPDEDE